MCGEADGTEPLVPRHTAAVAGTAPLCCVCDRGAPTAPGRDSSDGDPDDPVPLRLQVPLQGEGADGNDIWDGVVEEGDLDLPDIISDADYTSGDDDPLAEATAAAERAAAAASAAEAAKRAAAADAAAAAAANAATEEASVYRPNSAHAVLPEVPPPRLVVASPHPPRAPAPRARPSSDRISSDRMQRSDAGEIG